MRTKEEIRADVKELTREAPHPSLGNGVYLDAILEVLFDVRELLASKG